MKTWFLGDLLGIALGVSLFLNQLFSALSGLVAFMISVALSTLGGLVEPSMVDSSMFRKLVGF